MWLKQKAQEQLKSLLQRQGFDMTTPVPDLAWQVFKQFVQASPPNRKTVAVGVEVLHVWDRDNVLWLEFACQFEDENSGCTNMGCLFSREVPPELERINKGLWWSPTFGDLSIYFAEVEAMPEFKACLTLGGWEWE